MPRSARQTPAGYVYHALNRANARLRLFRKAADYAAFLRVFDEALERHPLRVLGYCLMPTHWHVVLWPEAEGQLSSFLRWLTLTHSIRWHTHHHSTGSGHVYQNRFKAFAVAADDHLLTVLRYVERNPLRAGLVERRRLALVELGLPTGGRRGGGAAIASLADRRAGELVAGGEQAPIRSGIGSPASIRVAGPALRLGGLGARHCAAFGLAGDDSPTRPAAEAASRRAGRR